jgi:hypothetical protein
MGTADPQIRRADFAGHGLVTFLIVDAAPVIRIIEII